MLGTVPLFIVAGFLEGYLTRHTEVPDAVHARSSSSAALPSSSGTTISTRVASRVPCPLRRWAPARLSPDKDQPIDRTRIRGGGGETLEATFSALRQSTAWLFGGAAGLAVLFTGLSFFFFDAATAGRYIFDDTFFIAEPYNFQELFTTYGRGRGLTYILLVAAFFYGTFRLTFQIFWRATDMELLPAGWRSEAYLGTIAPGYRATPCRACRP